MLNPNAKEGGLFRKLSTKLNKGRYTPSTSTPKSRTSTPSPSNELNDPSPNPPPGGSSTPNIETPISCSPRESISYERISQDRKPFPPPRPSSSWSVLPTSTPAPFSSSSRLAALAVPGLFFTAIPPTTSWTTLPNLPLNPKPHRSEKTPPPTPTTSIFPSTSSPPRNQHQLSYKRPTLPDHLLDSLPTLAPREERGTIRFECPYCESCSGKMHMWATNGGRGGCPFCAGCEAEVHGWISREVAEKRLSDLINS